VALVTGLLFGAVPALRSARVDLAGALRSVRLGAVHPRLRRILVICQVGLATTLLACSALLLRSILELHAVKLGFDPGHALVLRIDLPESRYARVPAQARFWDSLLEGRAGAAGGGERRVRQRAPARRVQPPARQSSWPGARPPAEGSEPSAGARVVSPGYFAAMHIPLLRGRLLEDGDRAGASRAVVVNEALVRAELPGVDPIGERIRFAREVSDAWMTIVGVVGDVKHLGLDRPQEPTVYVPHAQNSNPWHRWGELVVRAPGRAQSELVHEVRERVRAVDPLLPVTRVRMLSEVVQRSLDPRRFELGVLGSFALLALLLSATGVYGLIAYGVTRRVPELGLRKALGAPDRRVLGLVLGESAALTGCGVLPGLAGGAAAGRLMRGLLYGIEARDPVALGTAAMVVLQVGLLAAALPAVRAARIEPGVALRAE
jgi:putative ABC transport system permease protein